MFQVVDIHAFRFVLASHTLYSFLLYEKNVKETHLSHFFINIIKLKEKNTNTASKQNSILKHD